MKQVNELRIGNWVEDRSDDIKGLQYSKVEMIGHGLLNDWPEEWFSPIPITPEILEWCGFTLSKWPNRYEKHVPLMNYNLYIEDGKLFLDCMDSYYNEELEHISNLHQLQNLYFSLTGEELQIKNLQPS